MKSKLLLTLILFIIIFAVGCQKDKTSLDSTVNMDPERESQSVSKRAQEGQPIKDKIIVSTTILPIYDLAVHIGGDYVEVTNLLPPGGSPHTFEPGPDEAIAMERAQIIFKLGLGLDDWLEKLISRINPKDKTIVEVSSGIETLSFSPEESAACCDGHEISETPHLDAHAHDSKSFKSSGVDPHIWMDPLRMKQAAKNVLDAYIEAMPHNKEYFTGNYEKYINELDQLHNKYVQVLSQFKKKDFVTYHSFLNYMADRYGMNQAAVIIDSPGKDPDPAHIINVIELLKSKGVKVVFVEPQFSPKSSEVIAVEIKGKIIEIDPLGNPHNPKRDTYIKNMEENLKSLQEAFKSID